MNPALGWNAVTDVERLFDFPFMVNALEAGTLVAVLAGLVGWYMVLRQQSFAGHTLAVMAFPGSAGAALAGIPLAYGYYGACAAAALAIAGARRGPEQRGSESAAIGTVQATGLAVGFLFLSLYHGVLGGLESLLFGSLLGVGRGEVAVLVLVTAAVAGILALVARPLLFASADPELASVHGVPVGALSAAYLLLLGVTVAAVSQITGALLVFALLVSPAAAAQKLTARPAASLALTLAFALATVWLGLAIAYYSPYPVGFFVTSVAFALYLAASAVARVRR